MTFLAHFNDGPLEGTSMEVHRSDEDTTRPMSVIAWQPPETLDTDREITHYHLYGKGSEDCWHYATKDYRP